MADAQVSKTCGDNTPCGFDSLPDHIRENNPRPTRSNLSGHFMSGCDKDKILSNAEAKLLEAAVRVGSSNKKTASKEFGISPGTAKNRLHSIYLKLGIHGKRGEGKLTKAIIRAVELGEIEGLSPTIDETKTEIFRIGQECKERE